MIVKVARKLIHKDVLDLFYERGVPVHTHQMMVLSLLRKMYVDLIQVVCQAFIFEPGSPWNNGCSESFNSKMRDELIDGVRSN